MLCAPIVPHVAPLRFGPGVGERVPLRGGLLVPMLVGGELHPPMLVGTRRT